MARNNLQKLKPAQTVALGTQMKTTIGPADPSAYGTSSGQYVDLLSGIGNLSSADQAVVSAKAAYHQAVTIREQAHGACTNALASIARTVYGNPAVTAPMIDALGLSPRSTSKTKVKPQRITALTADTLPSDQASLAWSRSGNPQGTTFVVESQSGTGPWTTAGITTKTKLVLSGVVAGVPTNFRVTAVKDDVPSAASPVAPVYPATNAAQALRLAA